jgi:hypothetical protein
VVAERRTEGRLSEREPAEQRDRRRLADEREPEDQFESRLREVERELYSREQQAGVGVRGHERHRGDGTDWVAPRADDAESHPDRHRPERPDGEQASDRLRRHPGGPREQRHVDEGEAGQEGDEENSEPPGATHVSVPDADMNITTPRVMVTSSRGVRVMAV